MSRNSRQNDRLNRFANGAKSRSGVRRIAEYEPASSPAYESSGSGGLSKQVVGIAVGVAITFGLLGLSVQGMRSVERGVENHYNNLGSKGSEPVVVQRQTDDQEATQRRREYCAPTVKIRTGFEGTSDFSRISTNLPSIEAKVLAHGEYLDCLMRKDQDRFCSARERESIVAEVRQFTSFRSHHADLIRDVRKNPQGRAAIKALVFQGVDLEYARQSQSLVEETTSDLETTLKNLVEAGYLSTRDFGWGGPPKEFAQAFAPGRKPEVSCK